MVKQFVPGSLLIAANQPAKRAFFAFSVQEQAGRGAGLPCTARTTGSSAASAALRSRRSGHEHRIENGDSGKPPEMTAIERQNTVDAVYKHQRDKMRVMCLPAPNASFDDEALPDLGCLVRIGQKPKEIPHGRDFTGRLWGGQTEALSPSGRVATAQNSTRFCGATQRFSPQRRNNAREAPAAR